jgi:thiol-disulfide isomerase/thioredoxin
MHWKLFIVSLIFSSTVVNADTPDMALRNLRGEVERLSDLRDRIVVLNFWATWCAPCEKEIPTLVRLHNTYASRGVEFVGASIDDAETQKDIRSFVRRYRIPFRVWLGASEAQQAAFRLGTSIPATVILDRDGRAMFRMVGEVTQTLVTERLEWLLSARAAPAPAELVLPPGITPEHFREHELGLEDEHEEEEKGASSEVPS